MNLGKRLLPTTLSLILALSARSQPTVQASLNELNQAIGASDKFDQEKLANIQALKKPFLDNKNGDLPPILPNPSTIRRILGL